jgi:hypothetical protein
MIAMHAMVPTPAIAVTTAATRRLVAVIPVIPVIPVIGSSSARLGSQVLI